MRSIRGWAGNIRAARSSVTLMILSRTATARHRRTSFVPLAAGRLAALGLELHPGKTKVVYCKDTRRRGNSEHVSFDFLGYTFRGRVVRGQRGFFVGFNPAMSNAAKADSKADQGLAPQPSQHHGPVRPRRGHQCPGTRLGRLLRAFYRSRVVSPRKAHRPAPRPMGNAQVQATARQAPQAWAWLDAVRQRQPTLFVHWHLIAHTSGRAVGAG